MTDSVTPALAQEIAETQNVLSFLRRPPLTQKLLMKPPFKFIHDIVTEVMKTLDDVPKRLFTDQQLDRNNFTLKEQKVAYLDKLILWISYLNRATPDVNINDLLAGKVPERTNRLLQALGKATKIAEGEPDSALKAADYANGRGPGPSATPNRATREKPRTPKNKGPNQALFDTEDDEDDDAANRRGVRIIEDRASSSTVDEGFQVVSVADGKVKTRQMMTPVLDKTQEDDEEPDDEAHGVLVRKILDMKRGIEEMERRNQRESKEDLDVETSTTMERQQKEREQIKFRREVASVRRKIQTLSACVVPMGKEMDEVQVAVDVMVQEHARWRNENAYLRERLVQERTASEAYFAPLKTKLKILQTEIEDKREQIRSQRRSIRHNDIRVKRILGKSLMIGKEK